MSGIHSIGKRVHIVKERITAAHVMQSAMAAIYILAVFLVMNYLHNEMAVASLGASAFIAFAFPRANSSRPRLMIGGYVVGVISGLLCYQLNTAFTGFSFMPGYIPVCALAVFVSMFTMTVTDCEHPAAAALAVAITISSNPVKVGLVSIVCIVMLSALKELFKKHLRDL